MRLTGSIRSNAVTALTAIIAAGSLTLGVTMALFSATDTSGTNTFASGTVEVGPDGASTTCAVTGMAPGDSSTGWGSGSRSLTPCNYKVKYTGSEPAYLAVDILIDAGTTPLYTAAASGLQMRVGAGAVTFMDGTSYTRMDGTPSAVTAGTPVTNLLLSTTAAQTGETVQFDVDYLLPTIAPNALQGGSASVSLTFHAVQAANQSTGSCVAGHQCSALSWG